MVRVWKHSIWILLVLDLVVCTETQDGEQELSLEDVKHQYRDLLRKKLKNRQWGDKVEGICYQPKSKHYVKINNGRLEFNDLNFIELTASEFENTRPGYISTTLAFTFPEDTFLVAEIQFQRTKMRRRKLRNGWAKIKTGSITVKVTVELPSKKIEFDDGLPSRACLNFASSIVSEGNGREGNGIEVVEKYYEPMGSSGNSGHYFDVMIVEKLRNSILIKVMTNLENNVANVVGLIPYSCLNEQDRKRYKKPMSESDLPAFNCNYIATADKDEEDDSS